MQLPDVVSQPPAASDEASKKREFSYKRRAIVTGVFVLFALGGACLTRWAVYRSGTANDPAIGFLAEMAFLPLLALTTLILVVRGFLSLFKRPGGLMQVGLKLAFTSCPLLVIIAAFMISQPAPSIFLSGFEHWALTNVDIEAIQQWLITDGAKYSGQSYVLGVPDEFPKCLVELRPESVSLNATPEGEATIDLRWGRNLVGSWGVIVEPPTMKTPRTDVVEIRRIGPGVYAVDHGE